MEKKGLPRGERYTDKKGLDLIAVMNKCERNMFTLLHNLPEHEVSQLNILSDKIRS